jgi:glutathione S-transferase
MVERPCLKGRAQAAAGLSAGWAVLSARMVPTKEGPFFCGAQFTVFECAVLPW